MRLYPLPVVFSGGSSSEVIRDLIRGPILAMYIPDGMGATTYTFEFSETEDGDFVPVCNEFAEVVSVATSEGASMVDLTNICTLGVGKLVAARGGFLKLATEGSPPLGELIVYVGEYD